MSLAGVAKETVAIVERGTYTCSSGHVVNLRSEIDAALAGTVLYRPGDLAVPPSGPGGAGRAAIEVWADSTGGAARRLAAEGPVAALVFASAKNPGGGFMGGAKAQEEDIARCSAHYHCVRTQRGYYEANRVEPSMLYTDHIIYAPEVPFFRDERLDLVDDPFLVSLVTAPAPNAGEHLRREPDGHAEIAEVLRRRAGLVLQVLAHQRQRTLVLGAWGCGVFRNEPTAVAQAFKDWLEAPAFAGAFDRVVFAIYERGRSRPTVEAFAQVFARSS